MDVPETHLTGDEPRRYHSVTLQSNGLRVCIVSDPAADRAAAAVGVGAGQLHDTVPGIAHLTEHMLFMGSTSYPVENEYDQYVQQSGGHSNAYTDLELTVFYFDVASSGGKLRGGLDRLACALSEPLVSVGSVERELQAVDSEHAKNVTQDHWRIHQLTRTVLGQGGGGGGDQKPQHAYANFGTGNKASLLQQAAVVAASDETAGTATAEAEQQQQYQRLRDEIMRFYKQHYTAENMTLAVLGSQSVAELQQMVEEVFAKLPTRASVNSSSSSSSPSATVPPLPNLPDVKVVQWVPLRGGECSQLELHWILPGASQWAQYETKPARYWSHLLGHEGPGSLLAALRDKQWAQELSADDVSPNVSSFSLFTVTIELTATGLQHVDQVLQMLYYYIDTVLSDHIPAWVYDELKVTGDTSFQFLAKHDAAQTVSTLAANMHQYKEQHYLSGPYKMFAHDAESVRQIGTALSSRNANQNLLILLGSADYEGTTDSTDPWYGTQYRIVPPTDVDNHVWVKLQRRLRNDSDAASALTAALRLPAPNDMLPTDFSLVAARATAAARDDSDDKDGAGDGQLLLLSSLLLADRNAASGAVTPPPRCLVDTATCRLWYKPDAVYRTPKVNFLCSILSPVLAAGPVAAVLASLWVEVVTELCNEFSYAASMAGLHCGFQENTCRGAMELTVSGYNHKAGILLQRICDTLATVLPATLSKVSTASSSSSMKEEHSGSSDGLFFERMRNKLEQQYESVLVAQPYQHGSMVADLVLEASNKGSIHQRLAYLSDKKLLTSDDLLHFSKQMLSCFQLEVLVHGNVTPQLAKDWTNIILDTFKPVPPLRLPASRGVQLPAFDKASECIYRLKGWNEHDENSCVVNVFQVGLVDIPTNAALSLLLQLLREPAFNILRTEEQLGYIVFTSIKTSADNVKSLLFLIQSDTFDPLHVNERIENFLVLFRTKILVQMSDEDFQANVDAVCESMLEKSKNLGEESSKHWHVISNRTYQFHRLHEIAEAARRLTKVDVLRFFDRFILAKSPNRRKLSIQLFGTVHESVRLELLTDGAKKNGTGGAVLIEDPDEFARGEALFPAQTTASIKDFLLAT